MTIDTRPTLDAPDDDPHLWLEDIDGAPALAWVEKQNAATLGRFGHAGFAADRDTLTKIYDDTRKIPHVARRSPHLYNFWQDAANPRGLWRRTTMTEFAKDQPAWDVVLDLDTLAREENEDWIWAAPQTLPPDHTRAILSLSRGGGDATVLREFDIAARRFVADGFTLPEAKSDIEWLDIDTLLLASPLGEGHATDSGYARTIRLWKRGTRWEDAPVIFEVPRASVSARAVNDRTQAAESLMFVDGFDFINAHHWDGGRGGPKRKLDVPTDAWIDIYGSWLVICPRTAWTVNGATYPPGAVLGTDYEAYMAGGRGFVTLFEPAARRAAQSYYWARGRLVLSYLDELKPVTEVFHPAPGAWKRTRVEGLPALGTVDVWRLDGQEQEGDGELLANAQDPVTPPTLFLVEDGKVPAQIKRGPKLFATADATVTRYEAISSDGVSIPYTVVGPAGLTGDAPVHLTGYGGFQVTELPYYDPAIGKLWLERGGTNVVANIRGGGEFGPTWHEAGRRAAKRQSHDDFAAVARDLATRGISRPERIAAEGGSNGGLLIANMLTRHPQAFGALFCTIPLVDMRRYTKLLAGASWIAEYGDPEVPEDWAFIRDFSAYHAVAPGRRYPPILIATSRADDRVHPGHARKFAMKLQGLGYKAHFYEPPDGGHGYGKNSSERAAFTALGLTFLAEAIGGLPQHA